MATTGIQQHSGAHVVLVVVAFTNGWLQNGQLNFICKTWVQHVLQNSCRQHGVNTNRLSAGGSLKQMGHSWIPIMVL
jgi:hypothetical protein